MLFRSGARLGLALLAGLGASRAHVRAEDPPPAPPQERVTCRHWAVLLPEDAGQHRVYDGIRKGLELAQLERVCLKDVADDDASFASLVTWHKTLPEPSPLVFAIGRRAGARLAAAGYAGPGVLASVELTARGVPLTSEAPLGPRTAWVRAEVPAEIWGAAVRDLLGLSPDSEPRYQIPWSPPHGDATLGAYQMRFFQAARLRPVWRDAAPSSPPPQVLLHVRIGAGVNLVPFEEALAEAQRLRIPLLSDDPARFGAGATLLVVPDYQRLGRMAAEAGRRLWRNEPNALETLVVRSTEVWVDLVAAEAIGLQPPLTFLASADRVRAPPPKRPAASAAPGAPK
jgi:hypothetical protein